jgi:hypothetical protein
VVLRNLAERDAFPVAVNGPQEPSPPDSPSYSARSRTCRESRLPR